MPRSTKPGWIHWPHSRPRAMILEDLEPGGWLDGQDDLLPLEIFQFYKLFPEFEKVVFDQFEKRLKDHRQQASRDKSTAARDAMAVGNDRDLNPRQHIDTKGRLVFDVHPAKLLLRQDVKDKLNENMSALELQLMRHEYQLFGLDHFRRRIYQEVRRQKFIFYLNLKRTKDAAAPPC